MVLRGHKSATKKAASSRVQAQVASRSKSRASKTVVGDSPIPPGGPEGPVWHDPLSPLGSAVRYVASLSPKFDWVGIYTLNRNILELGPFIGEPIERKRIRVGEGVSGAAVAEHRDQNVSDVSRVGQDAALGAQTKSGLGLLIHDRRGEILGVFGIGSRQLNAFGPEEEGAVRRVAKELGDLWPAQENPSRR